MSACQQNCITATWDCNNNGTCLDPGTGQGAFTSLSACQQNCITATWDCDNNGTCLDPGTGQGAFTSLSVCQSNCIQSSVYIQGIGSLIIYPNPTNKIVNISFSNVVSKDIIIRLISSIGETVFMQHLESYKGSYAKKINLDEYSKGVYFLKIETLEGITNHKIILN